MILYVFCVVQCVSFCTGHFVMVPLNLTYLHCLQHSLFQRIFNLYFKIQQLEKTRIYKQPLVKVHICKEHN